MRSPNGKKLRSFIVGTGLSDAAAARALGVSRATMLDWISGAKEPKEVNRRMIDRWTDGVVAFGDWPSSIKERDQVAKVEPFRKDSASA
jgi:hypothetical protein